MMIWGQLILAWCLALLVVVWVCGLVLGVREAFKRKRVRVQFVTPSGNTLPSNPEYGETFRLTTDNKLYVCLIDGRWQLSVLNDPAIMGDSASWLS